MYVCQALVDVTDSGVYSRPYLLLELARLSLQQDMADIAQQAVEHIKESAHLVKVMHALWSHVLVAQALVTHAHANWPW